MKRWIAAALTLALCAGCASSKPQAEAVLPDMASSGSHLEKTASSPLQPQAAEEAEPLALAGPFLVTSLGQSTDALLVREMLTDLGVSFVYEPVAEAEDLTEYRTVLLAVRASNKALGAGGLTAAEEYSRSERLLASLPPACAPVMILLGDSSNQDPLTAELIELTLPYADLILTTRNGDRDGGIERYAREHQIPHRTCDTPREMGGLLGELIAGEASPGR